MKKVVLILVPLLFISCKVQDDSMYTVYCGSKKFTELKWVEKGIYYDEFKKLDGTKVRFKGTYSICEQGNTNE